MTTENRPDRNDAQSPDGFALFNFGATDFPLLLSVPHAGRDYPPALYDDLRVAPQELLRLEDRYADRLVSPAIADGMPAIIANRARAWIDLNRGEDELDPAMVIGGAGASKARGSAKMRGGLGLIPRRLLHCGEIWKRPLAAEDVGQRIERHHAPYHGHVAAQLNRLRDRFGVALLVDIHSMPPLSGQRPRIVIGDRFGQSATSLYSEMLLERLRQNGVPAALNHPYPGDYILRRHGNVRRNIHAIQIEVDRSLYLDSQLREPAEGLGATAALLSELLWLLVELLGGTALPMAAE